MTTAAVVLLLLAGFIVGALSVAVAVLVWLGKVAAAAGLTKGLASV